MDSMTTYEFLTRVYGENPDGMILINVSRRREGAKNYYTSHSARTVQAVAQLGLDLDARTVQGESVYHRITTLPADWIPDCGLTKPRCKEAGRCYGAHRGDANQSLASPGLFFDADVSTGDHKDGVKPADWPAFRAVLDAAGMPAETSLVSSGGGFYPGWLHPELVDVTGANYERYLTVQKGLHGLVNAWSKHLDAGKLDATFDLARVLRLPGTTNRKDKYGPDGIKAQVVHFDGPRWTLEDLEAVLARAEYPPGVFPAMTRSGQSRAARADAEFESPSGEPIPVTEVQAWDRINVQLDRCRTVDLGEGSNGVMGGAARMVGRYVGVLPDLDRDKAFSLVAEACRDNPYQDPLWYGANGNWTIEDVVGSGLDAALAEPRRFALVATVAETLPAGTPAARPPLEIKSPAEMMNWLQDSLGAGHLAGMFNRGGAVVYTPAVGSEGYVEPKGKDDSDGPMQIKPMSKVELAAHVQFSFQCFKLADLKDEDGKKTGEKVEVAAQFPLAATDYALAAPRLMPHLRPLRGVVHTPVVRADGTILDRPGYDEVTGLLYAPDAGLTMNPVPAAPDAGQIRDALGHLTGMVQDFPFVSNGDRANWIGMMLTPLLRELVASDRKMFAVNAHQAGSGKTLLAELAMHTHGAVFRAGLPEDEAEWRKWATGLLSTTTAPVVIGDNVSGTLRSAFLAGLLTTRTLSDRILGKTESVEVAQDRLWVITGNNVQIGADIARRLVTIAIDPGLENPYERSGFAIADLPSYARKHRGETLHALLTLVRAWVVAGRPTPARAQSDSFTNWEAAVAGILAHAGHEGEFNAPATRVTVKDVDKEEFGDFLEVLYRLFGEERFYTKDIMAKLDPHKGMDGYLPRDGLWIGPDDLPTARMAQDARAGRLAAGSLGKLMSYKIKQFHSGLALEQGSKDMKGRPWTVRATADAIERMNASAG